MKKTVIFILIMGMVSFTFLQVGNRTIIAENHSNELTTMASIFEKEHVGILEWTVHSREHLTSFRTKDDVRDYQAKLRKDFPNWDWAIHQKNNHWEATATHTSKLSEETIRILATLTNEPIQAYIIYEVKGTKWNQEIERFFAGDWHQRISNIFRGNPTNFTCMKADISDKIVTSVPSTINQWLNAFEAKEIESLHENEFVSISAVSPLFAETIQTKKDEMNLQLAIRSNGLGAGVTLVVGTPIITIEY